jgi:hypothetical protein
VFELKMAMPASSATDESSGWIAPNTNVPLAEAVEKGPPVLG